MEVMRPVIRLKPGVLTAVGPSAVHVAEVEAEPVVASVRAVMERVEAAAARL
jgi:hypothetical protein